MNRQMIIDITQLVHWQGKLTGIPRVMHELTIRYAESPNTKFVTWSPDAQSYFEVDIAKSIKYRGKKVYYSTPKTTLAPYNFFLRAFRKLRRHGIPVPSILINPLVKLSVPAKKFTFNGNEALFILWGEQNDVAFVKAISALQEKGVKTIQTAYDLLPLITPQYSGHSTKGMDNYTRKIVPKTDLVLSISEHTKVDLEAWLEQKNLSVPPVKVFRLGDDFQMSKSEKPTQSVFKNSALKGGDYLLTVGTIEARKNHALLYYVYKLAASKGVDLPKIVIVGRKGWMADGVYPLLKNDPSVKDKFVVIEDGSDEQLVWLYKNALFTVYPSFYEGWGLPIAESIARGTPCLCSNTSSMPEVAGKLAQYFNPTSTDECLAAIMKMLEPGALTAEKKRIAKYKITTWDETFNQVDDYVKGVV